MQSKSTIYVAGHRGLSVPQSSAHFAVRPTTTSFSGLAASSIFATRSAVDCFFAAEQPEYVFLAAARVGGILANCTYPADFLRDNLAIELNVIDAAYRNGCQKLLFLGSSCIYPSSLRSPCAKSTC